MVKYVDEVIYAEMTISIFQLNLQIKIGCSHLFKTLSALTLSAMLDEILSGASTEEFDLKEMITKALLSLTENDITLSLDD